MRARFPDLFCIALFLAAAFAEACGPDFPNRLLVSGIDELPGRSFRAFFETWIPGGDPPFRAVRSEDSPERATAEADIAELAEALGAEAPAAYASARRALAEFANARRYGERAEPPSIELPPGLPREFDLYLRGAIAWHRGEVADARAAFEALLALPEAERRRRSVWAAYMLGRSAVADDPNGAIVRFRLARDLAARGFSDRIGLAAASLGWEAQANLRLRRWSEAVELYAEEARAGGETAWSSLARVAAMLYDEPPEELRRLVREPWPRRLLLARVLGKGDAGRLLAALEEAGLEGVELADGLAAAAYREGAYDRAERWAARAPPDAPLALWVRSKLAQRAGDAAGALDLLREAARGFPEDHEWQPMLKGQIGVLELDRGRYVEALALLHEAGYRADAAYVAERVLTVAELAAFLRGREAPALSWLLGRRLARLRRFDEARPWFPPEHRERLDALAAALAEGEDPARAPLARSDALFLAARIARKDGLLLLGSELEPDWAIYGGEFEDEKLTERRASIPGERERILGQPVVPERRWHYRYVAAEWAWRSCELLPDGSDEKARRLCVAGGWLKARDPKAAERFYRELVLRCGSTALGREAAARKWFPPNPDEVR